jgi:O-succinylbenzoic acid--CoA ligase
MNKNLDWLSSSADIFPEKIFLYTNDKNFTYKELNDEAEALAVFLNDHYAIKLDDIVGIALTDQTEFIRSVFALWKLGAIPLPLNLRLLKSELEFQLKHAGAKYFLTDFTDESDTAKKFSFTNIKTIHYSKINFDSDYSKSLQAQSVDMNKIAVIIFTSGTTGKSKGAMLSFGNLFAHKKNSDLVLNQTSEDRWLTSLPFYHIGGFSIIIRALLSGASLILPSSLSHEDLYSSMMKFKPTLASLVSTQLSRFIEANIKPNTELRHILLGGGFISDELIISALKFGWKIIKVYGSTETCAFVTALNTEDSYNKLDSGGKPVGSNKVFIYAENEKLLPYGEPGEIVVESPSVAQGYINEPVSIDQKFKNNRYYTGDFGYLDSEGYLYIEARREDLIVTGGENVNPFEVELKISNHPSVKDVCVIGLDDSKWGHEIAAVISLKKNSQLTLEELKFYLKDKIAGFKIPRKLFIIDDLPKTSLGKIRRDKIKALIKEIG